METNEKKRDEWYVVYHVNKKVAEIENKEWAIEFARTHCKGSYEFVEVRGKETNELVYEWTY